MTRFIRPLSRFAYSLFLGLTVLCVTAMPMLAAEHDLHQIEHLLTDGGNDTAPTEPFGGDGIDQLHAEDGCLHSSALASVTVRWTLPVRRSEAPIFEALPPSGLLSSRFLRPPIA